SFAPIPKSDERFARQYRCGPPPEFPLASPRSGIVHHLSGPDRHAHTRTLLRKSRSVGCAPVRDPANQLPCALRVYSPVDSHTCQTPWSMTHRRPPSLPSRQFQALFDSLFKVLFIFTSRYLFAIGLSPIFSLGRNLPPDWGCIPKQPDS
ncbi:unnamed protein product, partial [Brassica rapa subsp. trilocularis]